MLPRFICQPSFCSGALHALEPSSHDYHHHLYDAEANAKADAHEIKARFEGRRAVGNWEIAWFGFTDGLLPCPAAIALLLICLQPKALTFGMAMVAASSVGLAITLVTIDVVAARGMRRAAQSWSSFDVWAR